MELPSPAPDPELKQASCSTMSTPPYKLPLFSLPYSKPPPLLPADGITPPPNTVAAAIPFLWEEEPGKPRSTSDHDHPPKSKTVRSLDLPPRLTTATASPFNNGNNHHSDKLVKKIRIEVIPSPTTVLSGPYEAAGGLYTNNNNSKSLFGSPEKVLQVVSNKGNNIRMPLRKLMKKERSSTAVKFSSWRWDNFRDSRDQDRSSSSPSSSVKLCSWRWDSFRDLIGDGGGGSSGGKGGGGSLDSGGNKIGRVARRNSFTFGTATTSGFLANVYGSLKQAMPWRSRR